MPRSSRTSERYKKLFDLSQIGFAIAEDPDCKRVAVNAWLAERLRGTPRASGTNRDPQTRSLSA